MNLGFPVMKTFMIPWKPLITWDGSHFEVLNYNYKIPFRNNFQVQEIRIWASLRAVYHTSNKFLIEERRVFEVHRRVQGTRHWQEHFSGLWVRQGWAIFLIWKHCFHQFNVLCFFLPCFWHR